MITKLCFIKPDLDTVTTAAILLEHLPETICTLSDNADEDLLNDPEVLCIECGGNGDTKHNNFDHHGSDIVLPCAAEQAWKQTGANLRYKDFIKFVSDVDLGYVTSHEKTEANPDFVPFSYVFSGMLLTEKSPLDRMVRGFELVKHALSALPAFNPYHISRFDLRFQEYINAKNHAQNLLLKERRSINRFALGNLICMYLSTIVPGVHGLLRTMGADLSIAHNPTNNFYSVSVRNGLEYLMPAVMNKLNEFDPGWGGHPDRGIIGSPRKGTILSKKCIFNYVQEAVMSCAKRP